MRNLITWDRAEHTYFRHRGHIEGDTLEMLTNLRRIFNGVMKRLEGQKKI